MHISATSDFEVLLDQFSQHIFGKNKQKYLDKETEILEYGNSMHFRLAKSQKFQYCGTCTCFLLLNPYLYSRVFFFHFN